MLLTLAAALLLQGTPAADTLPGRTPPAAASAAYGDAFARELVSRAREYRRSTDLSVSAYQVLARERTSAGLRMMRRERTLFTSEKAARIDWRREGPVRIDVLGRRERSPDDDDEQAKDVAELLSDFGDLAFDPAENRIRFGVMDTTWVPHPLSEGSEAFYRFRSGDTLAVRLPGGQAVRVHELRVEPRRAGKPLVSGSIWLDDRSYGIVRTLLRLNAPLTEQIRASVEDDSAGTRNINVSVGEGRDSARAREERSRWSLVPAVRLDVRYMTTEYALVEGRWWMPTLNALEGTLSIGSGMAVPVRFERSYTQYRVQGSAAPVPGQVAAAPPAPVQACKEGDEGCRCVRGSCRVFQVNAPEDLKTLENSPELPPALEDGAPLMSGKEVEDLADEISRVAATPWLFGAPSLKQAPVLLRYNRVEALSVGTRATVDFGPLQVDGTARVATSNWEPDLELGVRREGPERRLRLAGYYRLAAADPSARPLGIGNSLGALLWGTDSGDYFRAWGAELVGGPGRAQRPWYEWRLFAERQRAVATETDFSLRGVFDDGWDFRPNIRADAADQFGAALLLRPVMDREVLGTRWGLDVGVEGQGGDFEFARPAVTVRMGMPLPFGLEAAFEAAGGTSFGDVPVQGLWRLGGTQSLRGYENSSSVGNAFWRGRAEFATDARDARIALFTDVGAAGDRDSLTLDRPLWSVGAGASILEGLLRFDVARAMRGDTGWRLHVYLDGTL